MQTAQSAWNSKSVWKKEAVVFKEESGARRKEDGGGGGGWAGALNPFRWL